MRENIRPNNEKRTPFQEVNSYTCGPNCLAMVYAMRHKDISVRSILYDFHHPSNGQATYVPQMAQHLLSHGLKPKLFISGSKISSPAWSHFSRQELMQAVQKWLDANPKGAFYKNNQYFLAYLKAGGESVITSYSTDTIKHMLDTGSLVIICLDEAWLWGHRIDLSKPGVVIDEINGQSAGHFVVVINYDKDEFEILDPYPTNIHLRHGQYKVDGNQLINASLTWDPQIIEIKA